jgi:hypothetical protein
MNPASKELTPETRRPRGGREAVCHIAPEAGSHTTYRGERNEKTGRSAIRRRFVPALVEELILGRSRDFHISSREINGTARRGSGGSLPIQHLVRKSDSKSILSREQKLNQRESAIRLRFVLKLFRLLKRRFAGRAMAGYSAYILEMDPCVCPDGCPCVLCSSREPT